MAGSQVLVSWDDLRSMEQSSGVYLVEYSTDNGDSWSSVSTVDGANSLPMTVPAVTLDQCLIRVVDAANHNRVLNDPFMEKPLLLFCLWPYMKSTM